MGFGVSPPVVVVCINVGGMGVDGLVFPRFDMGLGVSPSEPAVEGCIGRQAVKVGGLVLPRFDMGLGVSPSELAEEDCIGKVVVGAVVVDVGAVEVVLGAEVGAKVVAT